MKFRIPERPRCPLCQTQMEERLVSACMECGGDPRELRHMENGAHSYDKVLVFGLFPIILCDFCQIDFGSYPSYYFGLPRRRHLGFHDLTHVSDVRPLAGKDWYCPECDYRLAFLHFVSTVRSYFKAHPESIPEILKR